MSLLDEFPFPFADDNARRLLELLATTYERTVEIHLLIDKVGLPAESINLEGSPRSVWANVLNNAAAAGKVRNLVSEAARDHPQLFQAFLEDPTGDIAAELGISKSAPVHDRYFFLIRLGDNWTDYPFSWEPFRDIAEPLQPPEGALPIVMHSVRDQLSRPRVSRPEEPFPHVQIVIAPGVPVAMIVDAWVQALRDAKLSGPAFPAAEFFELLGLTRQDVRSDTASFFLPSSAGIDKRADDSDQELPLSATVREVGTVLSGDVGAFDIASALIDRHPEYAGSRLAGVVLTASSDVERYPWSLWKDSVSGLYDRVAVSNSRHQVIDGRLFLVGLGLLDARLRARLDELGTWVPLLLEIDEAVAPFGSQLYSFLQFVPFAHGYQSDQAAAPDQLGIQGEVNALCEVLTDPAVRPPLAVGLFGEWGSGKSFFMDKMRERVAELTSGAARRSERNIVQIRFNAWHYADASLWASLAVEIFERLADPEPVEQKAREHWLEARGDPRRRERIKLFEQLETFRTAQAALDAERRQLEARRDALEEKARVAREQRGEKIAKADLINVLEEVMADKQVKTSLDTIGKHLGAEPAVDELAALSTSLRSTSGYLATAWQLTKSREFVTILAALTAVLIVGTAALLLTHVSWLLPVAAAMGSALSAVTIGLRYVRPAAEKVEAVLKAVEVARAAAARVRAKQEIEVTRQRLALQSDLEAIDREIDEAVTAAVALEKQVAAKTAEVAGLTVGRQLYDFLADRAAGYQKHLGIVGMLHRDFRFLDYTLRALPQQTVIARHERAPNTGAADVEPDPLAKPDSTVDQLPAIDRVILYVDDLDRCPPAKVLEVLEAIHLLLALELFVVVVGVDSRWLLRSLHHQYRKLATATERASDEYLRTMPTEYLEKIFQIPLTLARMDPAGYSRLISSLAPTTPLLAPPEATPSPSNPPPSADELLGGQRSPTRSLLQVQPGSSASTATGGSLDLTEAEVTFAKRLGQLVDSPRAAKRLMNIYRLVRATQQVGPRSQFLGSEDRPGDYQAVLMLLAISAGYPALADRVLIALETDAAKSGIDTWAAFVAGLNPAVSNGQHGALVPSDIKLAQDLDNALTGEVNEWTTMYNALHSIIAPDTLNELAPYRQWGPRVARFSFTL